MTVGSIRLDNFRNFRELELSFAPGVNIIYGKNGQGKTNLLEAVYMLSITKSMRGARDRDCVMFGQSFARVAGKVYTDGGTGHTLEMSISGEGKGLRIDGVGGTPAREWIGCLPVVFFGPQEMEIVRAGPSRRRRLLDTALCQIKPRYTRALSMYKKAHEHKKGILSRAGGKPSLALAMPEFDLKLAQSGAVVWKERAGYAVRLAATAANYHRRISGGAEDFSAAYAPGVPDTGSGAEDERGLAALLMAAFERSREHDLRAARTRTGMLYDDLDIRVCGRDARAFASQGQARTAALALKLAERDILREELGEHPVLLLDDVMSELDGTRRAYLTAPDAEDSRQCLITDCGGGFGGLKNGKTIYIENGEIREG